MGEQSDIQLLRDYVERGREDAFREVVTRHADLVYSAALRQLNSSDLACDIAQGVFIDLARKARHVAYQMTGGSSLAGWLHRSTRYAVLNHWRDGRRRRANERQAMEQLLIDSDSTPKWEHIGPLLDEALDTLDDQDREILVLRFFKNQDFRAVGLAIGVSDDTAQKRASRAMERLREFFAKRNVTIAVSGLAVLISANAVHSAPVGLAATIASAALSVGTAAVTSSAIATAKIIAMTTLQKTIVALTVAALAGAGIYEAQQASQLRKQNEALQQQQAALATDLQQWLKERERDTNRMAALMSDLARLKKNPSELSKLRAEVGALRQDKAAADSQNSISKALANPETRKTIREHNKMVASGIYSEFAKRLQLTPEQTAQLDDMLADHAMDNIDLIVQALRDGKTPAEVRQIFSASDAAFQDKVKGLLGDDGLSQFEDYTKNLGTTVLVDSFAGSLTGDPATVAEKKNKLTMAMQAATQSVLAAAGLPANYQTLVAANPCNFASQEEADYNLQLKDRILAQTAANASAFLTPDELSKFEAMRATAIKNTQNYIAMERALIAPTSH